MIDRDTARRMVTRFSGKPGYPATKEGKTALVDAFVRYAHTEQHALRIADDLNVETHFCPEPSEIYRVALATAPEREPNKCPVCKGTGFIETPIRRKRIPGVEHATDAMALEQCECRQPKGDAA